MTWIIDAFELLAGSNHWHWCATPLLSESEFGWKQWTRTWVSVASSSSPAAARAAASAALMQISTPTVSLTGESERFMWIPEAAPASMPTTVVERSVVTYSLDHMAGELVLIAPPVPIAKADGRWAGNCVFGRDYLLSLIGCAIEAGVLKTDDLAMGVSREKPPRRDAQAAPQPDPGIPKSASPSRITGSVPAPLLAAKAEVTP